MYKKNIKPLDKKVWLSSPTMYEDSMEYAMEAYETNWMSTVGENINEIEKRVAEMTGVRSAVALASGTSSIHLMAKLAGIKRGDRVFCSTLTFSASINPICYEGATPVFIDSEYETWNMDPKALEKAFEIYPDTKYVLLVHLYGVPAKLDEIAEICERHGATLIEDAAESFGATYKGKQTGSFGSHNAISFNGNKIITGSSGGMLLTNSKKTAEKARKWSTQSRENAPWYQHEEIGYNYRMSNVIAGIIRNQLDRLETHIDQKKNIYYRYKEGLKDLPISMNPFEKDKSNPNYWLSCLTIDKDYLTKQVRSDKDYLYETEAGKSSPHEILDAINSINAEGRPIWKPMHKQPIFMSYDFINRHGKANAMTNAYIEGGIVDEDGLPEDISMDIFNRGLCLPSDNKMTEEEQDRIIEVIKACFE
ncbi:DegT/DnrJ/EryC1/StrS family aminotransferase [Anaerococcus urinomassiliensis]|uniref:DegT/DnrJ/EryC1/StrS family aminotransferase n=1 Tax=Anaerococcus urinomassiliensis TaxID=1745712 RepID=UPI00093E1F4A|nr:DegT/DnrJ/EryC1/StrS family aminotransferase [Anaerococcus urinomassiliensis]